MNYVFVGRAGAVLNRQGSKSIFILQNGAKVIIENITLTAGVEVLSGELNLNNITFTSTSSGSGGIVYASGTKGNVNNSYCQ